MASVTMIPVHLLALCTLTLSHANLGLCLSIAPYGGRPESSDAPNFWWDITLNKSSAISYVINNPLTSEKIEEIRDVAKTYSLNWVFRWASGTSMQWLAGGYGFWNVWVWNSTTNEDISGGGFIYNETEMGVTAGANWLRNARTGSITWNCFMEGNVHGSLPWNSWSYRPDNGAEIGFLKDDRKWGFSVGNVRVLSKHCAKGTPVTGKRYTQEGGREVASSVENDPFKSSVRHKRSFFEKVGQALKDFAEKVKKFFSGGDGEEENPEGKSEGKGFGAKLLDIMMKIINMIMGKRGGEGGSPSMSPHPSGIPQGHNGEIPMGQPVTEGESGGDPPGGAQVPPNDAEEIDPDVSQNEAVRDWE